jgi:hypothetical protein
MPPLRLTNWSSGSESGLYAAAYRMMRPARGGADKNGSPSRVETVWMHNPVSTGKPFGPDRQPRFSLQYQCFIASRQVRGCALLLSRVPGMVTLS